MLLITHRGGGGGSRSFGPNGPGEDSLGVAWRPFVTTIAGQAPDDPSTESSRVSASGAVVHWVDHAGGRPGAAVPCERTTRQWLGLARRRLPMAARCSTSPPTPTMRTTAAGGPGRGRGSTSPPPLTRGDAARRVGPSCSRPRILERRRWGRASLRRRGPLFSRAYEFGYSFSVGRPSRSGAARRPGTSFASCAR